MQFRPPPNDTPTTATTITTTNNNVHPDETASSKRVRFEIGHQPITNLILNHDCIILTFDEEIKVYSALTGTLLQTLTGHQGIVWASSLHKETNTLITGGTDRTIRVWDLEAGVCTHVFKAHTSTIRTAQIIAPINVNRHNPLLSPKYEPEFPIIIAGSRDTSLSVWRLPIQELNGHLSATEQQNWFLHRLEGHTQTIRDIAAEGNLVASASYDNTARIWSSHTGQLIHALVGHELRLSTVVLDTANRQCFTGSEDSTIRVWSLDTGSSLHILTGHTGVVGELRLNGNFLVSKSRADGTVKVWDPLTANLLLTLGSSTPGTGLPIQAVQHDSTKLVTGATGAIQTWDIRTGQLLDETKEEMDTIYQLAYDCRRRVVAGNVSVAIQGSFLYTLAKTFLEILDYEVEDTTQ
ncbi:SCF ubiquitin ligase complex subunit cdc4 [Linnemannia gamsii]|uniref:SCF ubiquitin ligase complex subunit cdc4 n=1 Tax=Linnemannia gamsii TaxID=64522 RepID=A0ABQ7K513_9FUNG|nr:SCF ubiquitin ligase complex subunit cdc4 [Linnemannia gamsii]